jgi:hypothetical protein
MKKGKGSKIIKFYERRSDKKGETSIKAALFKV